MCKSHYFKLHTGSAQPSWAACSHYWNPSCELEEKSLGPGETLKRGLVLSFRALALIHFISLRAFLDSTQEEDRLAETHVSEIKKGYFHSPPKAMQHIWSKSVTRYRVSFSNLIIRSHLTPPSVHSLFPPLITPISGPSTWCHAQGFSEEGRMRRDVWAVFLWLWVEGPPHDTSASVALLLSVPGSCCSRQGKKNN